jgi:hypothetical protein
MTSQRQVLIAACTAIMLGSGAGMAGAETPANKRVDLEDARGGSTVVSVVGEVTAIDLANRIVSIKGPKGNIGEMRVDPAVKNLDQVKVGDRVRLSYRIGLALALVKGGDGIREKDETDSAAVAARGAKPGGTVTKRTTIVANVESVDAKRGVATLRGPSGDFVDVKVRDPNILHEVKAGDQVVASFTESVALRVQPASAK